MFCLEKERIICELVKGLASMLPGNNNVEMDMARGYMTNS